VFLMTSTHGHSLVLGVDPFVGVRDTGFTDGDCYGINPWGRALVMGNLMGRRFG
jgi:hypothetical protein